MSTVDDPNASDDLNRWTWWPFEGIDWRTKGRIEEDVVMIMLEHSFCKSLNVNL
jgi:hypothetical protein